MDDDADRRLETPVALIHFRRPAETARVFERIREARPRRLFLISDAPREGDTEEARAVEATRAVAAEVDWPCEVTREYAARNMGVKARVSSGITRVFDEVDEAILLEDDCLPHPSFFPYCEELLERYRSDERVVHVSGSLLMADLSRNRASYHFSRYPHIWGWATWRRGWRHFDVELGEWHALGRQQRERRLRELFADDAERRYWRYVWDNSHEIDNWDAQWSYACLSRRGLSIVPNRNLISNIGFGDTASSATADPHGIAARPLEGIGRELVHPPEVAPDAKADDRANRLFRREPAPPPPPPWRRAWHRALRAGGRALDLVPAPLRPRIRHRDRVKKNRSTPV